MKSPTQMSIPIAEIRDDLILLKDGNAALILQTSAVNFDLLSENEQLAIIDAFAGLLNSLSFPIQIVVRSKRLDISTYLKKLELAEQQQTSMLLKQMMQRYRAFVSQTIRENEVLDKQFYVVIQASYLEIGMGFKSNNFLQKSGTILFPRRDHIIRQLNRIGLKAEQLNTQKLTRLFYDIYNESDLFASLPEQPTQPAVIQANPPATAPVQATPQPVPQQPMPQQPPVVPNTSPQSIPPRYTPPVPPAVFVQPAAQPSTNIRFNPQTTTQPPYTSRPMVPVSTLYSQKTTRRPIVPFVVEELSDDYGVV